MNIEIEDALLRLYGTLEAVPPAIVNAIEEIDVNIGLANGSEVDKLSSVQVLCVLKYVYDHKDQL